MYSQQPRLKYKRSLRRIFVRSLMYWSLTISALFVPDVIFAQLKDPVVFAGPDTAICRNSTFRLDDLNASITGSAADGYWHTLGDGHFGDGVDMVRFSGQNHYFPGENDLITGQFTLVLISDDPDDVGILIPGKDYVTIAFIDDPILACNSHLTLSFDKECMVHIDAELVLQNESVGEEFYHIEIYDPENNLIPDNHITKDHHNQTLKVKVTYICTNNSCWSNLTVKDHLGPELNCQDYIIECLHTRDPEDLGLPLPEDAIYERTSDSTFLVTNLDFCSDVVLTFNDRELPDICLAGVIHQIKRTWKATDEAGNETICLETIDIINPGLEAIVIPGNFDDTAYPSLDCSGEWPKLSNQYPSPDTTGSPALFYCHNFEVVFEDEKFPLCGNGYKLLREWVLIDWCTADIRRENQFIYVIDKKAPEVKCVQDTLYYKTGQYACAAEESFVDLPLDVADCSGWTVSLSILLNGEEVDVDYVIDQATGRASIFQLNEGIYELLAEYIDDCGHQKVCTIPLVVHDKSPPFAICGKEVNVSFSQNEVARVYAADLDDGSADNCGLEYFEVKKSKTDECLTKGDPAFGEFIDFCCEEIGKTIPVILRVWDIHGNYNECEVSVRVQDKLKPSISCPPDITVNCFYLKDLASYEIFGEVESDKKLIDSIWIDDGEGRVFYGMDGYALDNCGLSIDSRFENKIVCNSGELIRTFIATDLNGLTDSCLQIISVSGNHAFSGHNIHWPSDVYDVGCRDAVTVPEVSGSPYYYDEHCGMVSSTFEDQTFSLSDDACLKIIRHWSVIDWCRYDANSGEGIWTYSQEIRIQNVIAPLFAFDSCLDTMVCINDEACFAEVSLIPEAEDDCTLSGNLKWHWFLDLHDDGSMDKVAGSKNFTEVLEPGYHRIYWEVEDGCGNIGRCAYKIEVVDCKAPVPKCLSTLTTATMKEGGSVTLRASDYNLGSFDNCTETSLLTFSFSKEIFQPDTTLHCSDFPSGMEDTIQLDIWVSDLYGNRNYCEVAVRVQDHLNACTDEDPLLEIKGNVFAASGEGVGNAVVKGHSDETEWSVSERTGLHGEFRITGVPPVVPGYLFVEKENVVLAGISVADLVQIRRHILQISPFDDPMKLIAADVNESSSVSASDMVWIQRAILGYADQFPGGRTWRFFPQREIVQSPDNPWNWEESMPLQTLPDLETIDFHGVKLGDVNFSADPSGAAQPESRSGESFDISIQINREESHYKFDFYLPQNNGPEGIQMAFELPFINASLWELETGNEAVGNSNFGIETLGQGLLAFCWTAGTDPIRSGEPFFSIKTPVDNYLGAAIALADQAMFESLAVLGEEVFPVSLEYQNREPGNRKLPEPVVYPNPFTEFTQLNIVLQTEEKIRCILTDSGGRIIREWEMPGVKGENLIRLDGQLFPDPGLYHIVIHAGYGRKSISLIKI